MSADLRAAAEKLAEQARPREELLAELAAAKPFPHPWRVVRQFTHLPEIVVCSHRLEVGADICARLRATRHRTETGGHYTVRRAES